jgi:hypothetical protein
MEWNEHTLLAILIQSWIRGYLARKRFIIMLHKIIKESEVVTPPSPSNHFIVEN